MEDGVLFEARIGAVWADKLDMVAMTDKLNLEGVQAVCIPDREHDERGREPMESKEMRERLTMKAIDFGVPVIWNARLQTSLETSRVSEPDALVRVGRKLATDGRTPQWTSSITAVLQVSVETCKSGSLN